MGFLNPLWLALGVAVAVPIILHLLQRHQGPRLVFPAVRYLRRAEREHARRIKLRQLLLLIVRAAAVLLIAAAAARPFVRAGGIGHEPTAVVLVLDNSLSSGLVVGDRRVLDELKDRALETLNRAGPDDRFWLLRAGAPWEPALPGDAFAIATRVRETQPTAAAADLVAAVGRARSILAQGAQGRAAEVQLLSDLQLSNLRGTLQAGSNEASLIVWSPQRETPPNAAIESIEVGGGLPPRAGERSTVVAQLGGAGVQDSVNVRLSIGSRITAAALARVGSAAVLPFPAQPASLVTGSVDIDADALRADDRRYFVAVVAPPPAVALTRSAPFISEALTVLANAGRIRMATSSTADVVIASAAAAEATGSSAVVVLPPTAAVELPATNRRLTALGIPWRYEIATAGGEARFAPQGDPLLRALSDVRLLQVYRLISTSRAATDSVLLRLTDGTPWAVRGERTRGGRYVVLGSPLATEAGTLATSPAMIPLIDRATGSWTAPAAPNPEATPGEGITLPAGADAVLHPDGTRDTLITTAGYAAGNQPGAYHVVRDGNIVAAYVVNPARSESNLRAADGRRLQQAFADWEMERAGSAAAWQREIYRQRVGREVWRTVLLILMALLLVEAIIAATGALPRRAVRPQES